MTSRLLSAIRQDGRSATNSDTAAAPPSGGLAPLLAAAVVLGFGHILVVVGQQTFVAHSSTRGTSDRAFGSLTAAASVGQLIGPPTVTVIASLSMFGGGGVEPNTTVGLLVCGIFAMIALPGFLLLGGSDRAIQRKRHAQERSPIPVRSVMSTPGVWRSLVVSGAVLVTVDLMYAFVPVWATDRGISATAVGLLLSLRAAVSVISRIGLTRMVGHFGRKALLIVSITAAAVGLMALPFVGMTGAILVMVGLGLGLGIPQPLTMSWVTELTPRSAHGATLGLRLTFNRLAQITLPLAVGSTATTLGVTGIFWANAALLMGAVVIVQGSTRSDPPQPDSSGASS
jgi:MFS family permease